MKRNQRKSILVIEDEPEICEFASKVFELEGYEVLHAEDGNEGLKLVREREYAMILLDLKLPEPDGWVVLEEIMADQELHRIPVVVFTATAEISQRNRAISMGVADYLVKPVSATRLKEIVTHVLRQER